MKNRLENKMQYIINRRNDPKLKGFKKTIFQKETLNIIIFSVLEALLNISLISHT